MAKNGLTLKALLQLETKQFQQGLNKIKKQLNGFGNFLKSAFAVGSITAFGKQMVNVSKDFEDAMARVKAITNASTTEFEAMSKEARRMGETTRYTASEAAAALENLTRNGMSASQATKALSGVMQLAQANAIGLAEAADIVTNTLNMFGLSVENTTRVNDVLSSTAGNAATNITELYEALVNAAPAARVLNFDIEEVSAAIGALAQAGVKGADAGTQLRMSLTKMADPKIIAKMQEMGVQIDEQSMKEEGLLKTVEKLRDAHLDLTDLVKIFSQRGAVGMQQLINSYEDFNKLLVVTKNSAGTTARMFQDGVGTTRKELDTLRSMYEGLLLTIGSKTSGVINGAVKQLQNLINNFKSVTGTLMNIASVVVPLLVRKIMVLGKTAGTTLAAIKTGVAGVKAAMGGWVTIIATLVTWIGTALYGAWAKVNQPIKDAKKNMGEVQANTEKMKNAANDLIKQIGPETDKTTLAGIVKKLTEMFPEFADQINNAARIAAQTGNWQKLKSVLQDIVDLQASIDARDAQQQLYQAQNERFGGQLYEVGRSKMTIGLGKREPDSELRNIYRTLTNAGYFEETVKGVFQDIASIITGYYLTEEERIEALSNKLSQYNLKLEGSIEDFIENSRKAYGGANSWANRATATGKEVHKADSTIVAQQYFQAKPEYEKTERELQESLKKREISEREFQEKMAEEVDKFIAKIGDVSLLNQAGRNYVLNQQMKYPGVTPDPKKDKPDTTTTTAKTEVDLMKEALTGYTKSMQELKNQLNAGSITQDDFKKSTEELVSKTWQAVTAFDNFQTVLGKLPADLQGAAKELGEQFAKNATDAGVAKLKEQQKELEKYQATRDVRDASKDYTYDFTSKGGALSPAQRNAIQGHIDVTLDYSDALKSLIDKLKEGIENGDFDLVKQEALDQLRALESEFDIAKREAKSFEHILNFSEAKEQIAELQEQLKEATITEVQEVERAFGSVTNALTDIFELFDEDIRDSEFFKGIEAFMTVLNSFITIFDTARTVIEAFGTAQKIQAQIASQSAAKQVAADMAVASAEGTKAAASAGAAAAGAGSSVSSIPIVGPILAVAAIGTVVAAILAAMSKFATGGIVGGNSMTGDKNVVRANSGEMILTKGQQATLFNAIANGDLGGGGNVEFKIRGADLIGVIENTQSRRRG